MGLWARNISSDLIDPFYMRHTAVTPDDLQLMCEVCFFFCLFLFSLSADFF